MQISSPVPYRGFACKVFLALSLFWLLASCAPIASLKAGDVALFYRSIAVSDAGKVLVSVAGLGVEKNLRLVEFDAATKTARIIELPTDISWEYASYNPVNQREAVVTATCFKPCVSTSLGMQIAVVNLDSGQHKILTEGFRGRYFPKLSPKARTIAFWDSDLKLSKGKYGNLSVTRDMTALGNTRSVRFRTELEREGFGETDGGVARDTANEVRGGLPADQQAVIEPG